LEIGNSLIDHILTSSCLSAAVDYRSRAETASIVSVLKNRFNYCHPTFSLGIHIKSKSHASICRLTPLLRCPDRCNISRKSCWAAVYIPGWSRILRYAFPKTHCLVSTKCYGNHACLVGIKYVTNVSRMMGPSS